MHFLLIKITSAILLIISLFPHLPLSLSLLFLSLSFFLYSFPCHYPPGLVRNVVAWNLDLIASQIDAMFFIP